MKDNKLPESKTIEGIESMIDPRDTPLIGKLGLDGAEDKFQCRATNGKIEVFDEDGYAISYNYASIFQKAVRTNEGETEFIYQANKGVPHLLRLVERMAFYSERSKGSVNLPRSAGGLGFYITDNVMSANGRQITKDHVDSLMEEIIVDGGYPDLLVMNPRIANDLRVSMKVRGGMKKNEGNGGVAVETILTKHGKLELVMDRWCPTDMAYILQSDKIGFYTLRPFESCTLARSGCSLKGEIIGEFSVLVADDEHHGKITEITT